MRSTVWVLALLSAATMACSRSDSSTVKNDAAPAKKAAFGTWGYDRTAMDATVKPGDDFFAYINGAWLKRTEIAPDRTTAGVAVVLTDEAERQVRDIVEGLAKDPGTYGAGGRRVGDFYAAWRDEAGALPGDWVPPTGAEWRSLRVPTLCGSRRTGSPSVAPTRPSTIFVVAGAAEPGGISARDVAASAK